MRKALLAAAVLCGVSIGAGAQQERFPTLTPEQMTPEQKRLADAIQSGPRAAVPGRPQGLGGPFNVWLRSPELGDRLQRVGEQLRFRSSIPAALNEFAILITAREWSSQYEWHAHHRLALQAGLPASVAADLAQGRRPEGMTEEQRIVYEFCTELHRNRFVSDATFAAAKQRFGEQGVVDLIGVSGYYVAVAMTLNTAQVGLPPGVEPPLPPLPR
jgi:4-carboxymuconolactone decarboxylase